MPTRRLLAILIAFGASASLGAQTTETSAKTSSVAGTWKWERDFNGNPIKYTLVMQQEKEQLSGIYKTVFPNGGAPGVDEPVEIQDARLDGTQVSFTVKRKFNDRDFTVTYQGKWDGDEIKGTAKINFGNGEREFDWLAKRTLGVAEIVGTWHLKLETANGVVEPSLTIQQVKDKPEDLEGTYHSTLFGDNKMEQISIKDDTLNFVVNFRTDNGDFQAKYTTHPQGNKIIGRVKADFGGQEREMSFTGERAENASQK